MRLSTPVSLMLSSLNDVFLSIVLTAYQKISNLDSVSWKKKIRPLTLKNIFIRKKIGLASFSFSRVLEVVWSLASRKKVQIRIVETEKQPNFCRVTVSLKVSALLPSASCNFGCLIVVRSGESGEVLLFVVWSLRTIVEDVDLALHPCRFVYIGCHMPITFRFNRCIFCGDLQINN